MIVPENRELTVFNSQTILKYSQLKVFGKLFLQLLNLDMKLDKIKNYININLIVGSLIVVVMMTDNNNSGTLCLKKQLFLVNLL